MNTSCSKIPLPFVCTCSLELILDFHSNHQAAHMYAVWYSALMLCCECTVLPLLQRHVVSSIHSVSNRLPIINKPQLVNFHVQYTVYHNVA